MDVAPRMRILGDVPKVPLTFCTDTPAACPSSERLMSATPLRRALSASNLSVAPVKRRRSVRVRPVTTTSLRVVAFDFSTTCMSVVAFSVCDTIPMYATVTCGFATSVVNENLPSTSVTVAILAPTTVTVAPITGSLSSAATTVPVILVCAKVMLIQRKSMPKHRSSFLFISI